MKQWVLKGAVLGFALGLAVSGEMLAKSKKSLTIYERARVNDIVLEPGDYKVEVAQSGDSADILIYKGKELIAKTSAQTEKLDRKADRNTVRLAADGSKAPKIIELRLSGDSQSYKLVDGSQMSQKAK